MGLGLGLGLDKPKGLIYFQNQFSMYFDGSDERIFTDADTVLQPTTYSFWCKASEGGTNKGVFGHGSDRIGAFHFNWTSSRPLLFLGNNYLVFWNYTSAQSDGEWHHWVVYADTNDITNSKLYVDGVLQTVNQVISSGSPANAYTEPLTIGSERQVGGNSFKGSMDEFAVFDRELTQAEITRMYNTYYTNNLVQNSNFEEIGDEEVTNGDFSQIGSDLASGYDFTSGWDEFGVGTEIQNSTSFVSQSGQGIYAGLGLVANKTYKIKITGTQPSGGYFSIKAGTTGTSFGNINGTSFNETIYATPTVVTGVGNDFYIRLSSHSAGTTITISSLEVEEVGQDWTFENGATMGDGVATIIGDGSARGDIIQDNVFQPNKVYKCVFDVTINSGLGLKFQDGVSYSPHNESIGFATTSGVYTFYFNSTSYNQLVIMRRTGGTAYDSIINSVSVKEVGQHWTFGTGWTVEDGKLVSDATSSYGPYTDGIAVVGRTYKVSFSIVDYTSGSVAIRCGGTQSSAFSGIGNYEVSLVASASSNSLAQFRSITTFTGSIDNIVVQELKHQATNLLVNSGDYQSANPLLTSTKSMYFDGGDEYLEIGDVGSVKSMSFWFNPDNDITAATTKEQLFGFNGSSYNGIRLGAATGLITGETLTVIEDGGGFGRTATTKEFDAGRWYHIVIAWNETANYFDIYVDGVLSTDLTTGAFTLSNWTDFKIGVGNNLIDNFNGKVTEVGNWDRTLTALEVASLYNQGVPTDLLVNRNNYQSGNPTLFNTKQVDFDGVDDYLEVGNVGSVKSMSFWFNPDNNITTSSNTERLFGFNNFYFGISIGGSTGSLTGETLTVLPDGSSRTATTKEFDANRWYHIAIAWNDTATYFDIYVDGVLSTDLNTGTHTLANWQKFKIGTDDQLSDNFNGKISQTGIFNSELTADEVSSLYNHGLPIDLMTDQAAYESSSNLVGYWRMGSGTNDGFPIISDQLSPSIAHISTTNLFNYSEDFLGNWSNFRSTLTPNETTSPDGTINAYLVEQDYPTTSIHGGLNNYVAVTTGVKYTYSFFVKKKEYSFIELAQSATSSGNVSTWFDVENGVVGNIGANSTAKIEDFGNGWYRCSISFTSIFTGGRNFVLYLTTANGSTTANMVGGAYIWGAQLEAHPVATPYIKSNGIRGQRKSSTTNLITYSEDFSNASWTKLSGGTGSSPVITPNNVISPDGTTNADKIVFDAGSGTTSGDQSQITDSVSFPNNTTGTASIYLKGENGGEQLVFRGVADGTYTLITLTTDWQRFSTTENSGTNTDAITFGIRQNVSGHGVINSSATVYAWGSQIEEQTQATPYIKTIGSPVTVEFYKENNYAEMVNLGGGDDFSDGIKNGSPYANILPLTDFSEFPISNRLVITPNAITSPDGTLNASKMQQADGFTTAPNIAFSNVSAGTYTVSAFAKKGTRSFLVISFNGTSYFDLQNGTITTTGSGHTASIENVGNDWYKCSIVKTITTAQTVAFYFADTNNTLTTADDEGYMYLYNTTTTEVNTGLQGYWKMGDGTNDEYPVIYDQVNPTLSSEQVTDGDFPTGTTAWNKLNGSTISGGVGNVIANGDIGITGANWSLSQDVGMILGNTYKISFSARQTGGTGNLQVAQAFLKGFNQSITSSFADYSFYITALNYGGNTGKISIGGNINGDTFEVDNVSVKQVSGNPATMIAMPEGNITNQYPLTKIRNYYRMGDGILDSKFLSYPTNPNTDAPYIFQDQTSPNLAHIPTTNTLLYSEDFSQYLTGGTTPTLTTGQLAPDGTLTATKVSGVIGSSSLYRSAESSVTATRSIYARTVSGTGTASLMSYYTNTNNTFTLTEEWQRFELTNSPLVGGTNFYAIDFRDSSTTLSELIIWGGQSEEQSQATAYIKSEGVAAVRKATTTNLLEYSEDFSQSYWTKAGSTVEIGFTSPDGTENAYKLKEDLNTSAHSLYRSNFSINTVRTFSVFAKASEKERISIYDANKFGRFIGVIFNLTSGIVESNQDDSVYLNPKIELISNGWYRCSVTWQNASLQVPAFAPAILSTNVYAGDGVSGIYVYGAQFEEQTQAETYAPTKGIPVTIDLFTENNYGHTQGGIIQKDVPRNS